MVPACSFRYPENVVSRVFVTVFEEVFELGLVDAIFA